MVKSMTVQRRRRRVAAIAAVVLAGVSVSTAAGAHTPHLSGQSSTSAGGSFRTDASDEWPITECGTFNGRGCAPTSERVDLERPTFSDPTHIDNPLFPVSTLQSVIQVGIVDGKPFRSETTTLPDTGVVNWYGTEVPVVLSQYVAYLDGKITEVALDRYAQADDGSVWYFGEDVIDYRRGQAYFTEGTWLAGRDGPPAMVMPAHPSLGDVFRVENVIGIVFEELTVIKTDKTMQGPNGPVTGAIVVDELGVSGGHSKKTLAPGYGEFLTRGGGELEAMAVATPTNDLSGGAPVEIRKILTAAGGTLEYVRAQDWQFARASVRRINDQLTVITQTQQPPRVMRLLQTAITDLGSAVHAKRSTAAERATFDVAQSTIDLESRYLDHLEIEVARFHLHTQKLRIDAAAQTTAGVESDVATLEWLRDRLIEALDAQELAIIDQELAALRIAADSGKLGAAADQATRLGQDVRNFTST
jgi:hypothetical protein